MAVEQGRIRGIRAVILIAVAVLTGWICIDMYMRRDRVPPLSDGLIQLDWHDVQWPHNTAPPE
jgi:hypothetical protein